MLVAQCTGSAPCELPTVLPWYFGLVLAAIWVAVIIGALAVGRRLLEARRERRRAGNHHPHDRRAIESSTRGTDVEPW